jgi:hypothetical protein
MNKKFSNKGVEHPSYKNGRGSGHIARVSRKLKSLIQCCEICGSTVTLEVHHLDHNPHNNLLDNLVVLCHLCHTNIHRKYTPEEYSVRLKAQAKVWYKQKKEKKLKDIGQKMLKEHGTESFCKASDLCRLLGVSRERIRQLRKAGRFSFIKIGRQYYYKNI